MSPPKLSGASKKLKEKEAFRRPSIMTSQKLVQSSYKFSLDNIKLRKLPLLKDARRHKQKDLMIKKLKQSSIVYNFMDPDAQVEAKDMKSSTLQEMIEFISTGMYLSTDSVYSKVVAMVSANIFRPFPVNTTDDDPDVNPDDSEPFLEASWPHLVLVYDFFIRFLDLPESSPGLGSKYIDQEFIIQLLDVFNSSDNRERLCVKTVLHRIYGKFLCHRPFIRQSISNIFLSYIYETEQMNGLSELLQIFCSIINGFVLPLKPEHKLFLYRILIPLHKPGTLSHYHTALMYCVIQFLEKDPDLTEQVLKGLFKIWPKTSSQKQVLFLNEIEEIIDVTDSIQFEKVQKQLFKQLAICVSSAHFLVSQRTLYFWNNEYFASLVEDNTDVVMPMILPSLLYISKNHWNKTILLLVGDLLKLFKEMDSELYDQLIAVYNKSGKK